MSHMDPTLMFSSSIYGTTFTFYLQKIRQMEKPFHMHGKLLFKVQIAEIIRKEILQKGKLFSSDFSFLL